jgi:ABC-type transport system substrate-binding protein
MASLGPLVVWLALSSAAASAPAAAPKRVYVGIYLHDVSDFDLKGGHFKADLRAWVKWRGGDEVPELEFENGEIDKKDEVSRESDGSWHSVMWRVQGTFRGDFPVHRFPFDHHELPIGFSMPLSEAVLVPDLGASSMSPRFSITGWLFAPEFEAHASSRRFGSDLGSVAHEGEAAVVQSVTYSVELSRPLQPYLLKFLLPLAMILAMAVLALFLPVTSLGERTGMGVTALLSCIAFHFTQRDTLPDVSYLVAADKLFLGAYVLIAAGLAITVVGYNLRERAPEIVSWLDRAAALLLPAIGLAGVLVLLSEPAPAAAPLPPPATALPTSRTTLVIGTTQPLTKSRVLMALTRRGLTQRAASGEHEALLAEAAPTMTNGLVHLLPDGGMRVRWRLKAGARWSDGRPITSEDLAANAQRLADADLRGASTVDERTIDLEYGSRDASRLKWGSLHPAARLGQAADGGVEQVNELAALPGATASGPFRLVSLDQHHARFERNPSFAGRPAAFERVELVHEPSPEVLAQRLEAGTIDLFANPPVSSAIALQARPDVVELRQPGETLVFLHPDVTAPPFDDVRARQALFAALDRPALVRALAPLPVSVARGLRPSSPRRGLAPEQALAAPTFTQLGLTGAKVSLFTARQEGGGPNVGALIAEQLGRAGLEVSVVEVDDPGALVAQRGHGGLVLHGRDADNLSRFFNLPQVNGKPLLDRPTPGLFDEAQVDLWRRLSRSFYAERRGQLEERLLRSWAERVPVVPLYFTDRVAFANQQLLGPDFGEADSLYWNVEAWHIGP